MAGLMGEKPYRPKKVARPYQVDFFAEKDMDYTNPYPCGVCGDTFVSRHALATHKHPKRTA